MSYNIDTWKTKRINNLEIPMSAFRDGIREDWLPKIDSGMSDSGKEIVRILLCCEGGGIGGTLSDNKKWINVISISMYGEGSGTAKDAILIPALKKSVGELEAVLIWEGGDSITRLISKNGEVTEKPIEL